MGGRRRSPTDGAVKRCRDEWEALARDFVEDCFRTGRVPRVAGMARRLKVSREWLTREYCAATGHAPAAAFRDLQIRRAQALLVTTVLSTGEIAREAAFGSTRAFYRTFLHCVGLTPTEFRRRAWRADDGAAQAGRHREGRGGRQDGPRDCDDA